MHIYIYVYAYIYTYTIHKYMYVLQHYNNTVTYIYTRGVSTNFGYLLQPFSYLSGYHSSTYHKITPVLHTILFSKQKHNIAVFIVTKSYIYYKKLNGYLSLSLNRLITILALIKPRGILKICQIFLPRLYLYFVCVPRIHNNNKRDIEHVKSNTSNSVINLMFMGPCIIFIVE